MQMPGPRDIVIYRPGPRAFSVVQKPWGWAHILVQKHQGARGDGNRSNWYLHYHPLQATPGHLTKIIARGFD